MSREGLTNLSLGLGDRDRDLEDLELPRRDLVKNLKND